jgi:hypothetical protein
MSHLTDQPAISELETAWSDCLTLEGEGAAYSSALQELKTLRSLRTSWYGDETKLMFALDKYLNAMLSADVGRSH